MTRTSLSCSDSVSAFLVACSDASFAATSFSPEVLDGPGEALGEILLTAFFSSSSFFFFFSCLARSSGFVSLVNAIVLPSGDQTGLFAPFGSSVNENESPPAIGRIDNCGGSGLPSFSVERTKSKNFPSGDQRGVESWSPLVNWCGSSPPAMATDQIEVL